MWVGEDAGAGRDRREDCDADRAADLVTVALRPEIIPVSCSRAPVRIAIETETTARPRPSPATSIPGRTSRG
jgi:hypothetical protein